MSPVVGIVMGSDSDWPVMEAAAQALDEFEIEYEVDVVSAHRMPREMIAYGEQAAERGLKAIIAGAGGAAHLPGMLASVTPLPVIGVPVPLKYLDGMDSLLSIVQMPAGVPVATVSVGGARNAGLLAARILASHDGELLGRMREFQQELNDQATEKGNRLRAKVESSGNGFGFGEMTAVPAAESLERARELLAGHPVVDGHNDLPWALRQQVRYDLGARDISAHQNAHLHTDLPRLREGGVGAQFWSVYVRSDLPDAVPATLEQIDCVRQLIARYPQDLRGALTAADMEAARSEGRIASLMGAEGGHSIANSLATLRALYALGVRYMTLTHNDNVAWADSATDEPGVGGLSAFGREVVREMNREGMLVDLSHVAATTMRDALDASVAPVIFSHSSSRAVCDHPRNIPDDVLERLPANGGVAMVTFVPKFVLQAAVDWTLAADENMRAHGFHHLDTTPEAMKVHRAFEESHPRPVATVATVADHLDHMREVAGIDHLGIGGDYDGTAFTPDGLNDVSGYPNLIAELLDRGWSPRDLAKLTWQNAVRVLSAAEDVARDLQPRRGPSNATLEQLDG